LNKDYATRKRPNPGLNYPDDQFYDFLQAQIFSRSTKILASPTLILQEGGESYAPEGSDRARVSSDGKVGREKANEAFVRVGTQFVTSYVVRQDINGNNFCEPVFGNAGLTFGARVDKIDDNGFVTFSLSPEISAAVGTQQIDRCGTIYQINDRLLDTGKVRVRDGQTLILTGVISDEDRSVVTKWPILGDLPLIGQFFRRSGGDRRKSELVIMVTPRVVKDDQGGTYGYGYQPSTQEARGFVYPGT
jgi:type IV pilus assembly protein PilQ